MANAPLPDVGGKSGPQPHGPRQARSQTQRGGRGQPQRLSAAETLAAIVVRRPRPTEANHEAMLHFAAATIVAGQAELLGQTYTKGSSLFDQAHGRDAHV